MATYKVSLKGKNLWITLDDEPKRCGFYTTRFVEAANKKEAENKAVQLIRDDPKFKDTVLNDKADPPIIDAQRIEPVKSVEARTTPGYVFYEEDKVPTRN